MKGKWAAGIAPRNLTWIMDGRLAASERPGGHSATHRKVRRQEEIIWLRENGFTCVISIMPGDSNLVAYTELGVRSMGIALAPDGPHDAALKTVFEELDRQLRDGGRILLHDDDLSDRTMAVVGGFLIHTGKMPEMPIAVTVVERLFSRQLGPDGRAIMAEALLATKQES